MSLTTAIVIGIHYMPSHVHTYVSMSTLFQIPISALNAVNQLLNNNQKNAGK